jgi:hypothetical protein
MTQEHFILYHPESETYMYAHNEDERDMLIASGDGELTDVTGQHHHTMLAEAQLGPFNPDAREIAFTEPSFIVGNEANTAIVDEIGRAAGTNHFDCLRQLLRTHGAILDYNGDIQGYRLKHNGTIFHGPTLESVVEVAYNAHVLLGVDHV